MAFTDEDFKLLKGEVTAILSTEAGIDDPGYEWSFRDINKMSDLLKRLEAAERVVNPPCGSLGCMDSFYSAWKISAGKVA